MRLHACSSWSVNIRLFNSGCGCCCRCRPMLFHSCWIRERSHDLAGQVQGPCIIDMAETTVAKPVHQTDIQVSSQGVCINLDSASAIKENCSHQTITLGAGPVCLVHRKVFRMFLLTAADHGSPLLENVSEV
ncbi:hypothetical protein TNCV_3684011 [Trichonephila clavipes]|nr:hypothetical protein TNCV_3684011 [Trichonephila clavipes]